MNSCTILMSINQFNHYNSVEVSLKNIKARITILLLQQVQCGVNIYHEISVEEVSAHVHCSVSHNSQDMELIGVRQ